MADLDDESFSTPKSIATLVKAAATARSILLQSPLNFSSVKRLIQVDEEEEISPHPDSEDALSEHVCEAAADLAFTERQGGSEVSVEPAQSLAALFDADSPDAKALQPKLHIAWDVSESEQPSIVGMLTCCEWSRDDTLGTTKFTQAYCDSHSIPRLSANNTLFVDVVSSSGTPRGVGALLLLSCYLTVCRSRKYEYLCTIAVSAPGKSLCEKLGFNSHSYRDGTQRNFCWARAGELTAADIGQRLRIDRAIPDLCWRHGFTPRTSHKRYSRCG